MDDFVRDFLAELKLKDYVEKFKKERIDESNITDLGNEEIKLLFEEIGPRAKFKKALQALKAQNAKVSGNRNNTDNGKRKSKGVSSCTPKPKRQRDTINSEPSIRTEVKKIMTSVQNKLPHRDNTELIKFLRKKISDLRTEKRELVGVFGRTGAGKSSLINAVIGEKDLLPSGDISACTTVMIKVEANTKNQKYEAEIEFITKEEWKHDLWFLFTFILNDADHEGDTDDVKDAKEMLWALYGDEWENNRSPENLCHDKHFREIPEFIRSHNKTLTCESTKELSAKLLKYTRSCSKETDCKDVERWFWPLVKCVTVRVPNNDLLQHVTLVDLPGSGDRNKSRDKMWKEVVGDCSTVWVVTDMNRPASDSETWDILENASDLMGNGGQCQQIHFICTKSDVIGNSKNRSVSEIHTNILKRNRQAKQEVMREFKKLKKTHIGGDCFKVFTVSSAEFFEPVWLEEKETEIPKLREILQDLNDQHSKMLNYQYVFEAKGILSLIQGARSGGVAARKASISRVLKDNISLKHEKASESMQKIYEDFETCLEGGVENSKISCEQAVKYFLNPIGVKGSAFHKTLKCVVEKNGAYKPKNKKKLNLNERLSTWLTKSIDEDFKKIFPNDSKCEPFNGAISLFSLDTERVIEEYEDVQLQLEYLRAEEEKMMADLKETIRNRKKQIYNSLTATIEKSMQTCYDEAEGCTGEGSLESMRIIIKRHVLNTKGEMFEHAKNEMLSELRDLMDNILKTLGETMKESIRVALESNVHPLPDVTGELRAVTNHYDQLKKSTDGETSAVCPDQPGPSTA